MTSPEHVDLLRRLEGQLEGRPPWGARVGEVPVAEYTLPERFEREREAIFARRPSLVAHQDELRDPGACLTVEVAGVPLVLVRGADGELRAFRNACRHRATELVAEQGPCRRKAFVCRYHGWTYDLTGRLIHVPHAEAFCGAEQSRGGLVAVHVGVRHGMVWAGLEPFDLAAHLAPLDAELCALGSESWAAYRRSSRDVRGNWKLILDAFLESYHIQRLHKDTLARFFVDSLAEAAPAGLHIRAAAARKRLVEARQEGQEVPALRELVTPNYILFPNAIFVLHPDYASLIMLVPLAADLTRFIHVMAIAATPRSEAEEAHWARSFCLIDEGVLASEDLAVVEAMQRGMRAGADAALLFGGLEHPALWLHERIEAELGGYVPSAGGRSGRSRRP
jgi:Rieske 2Fe-2S family protein